MSQRRIPIALLASAATAASLALAGSASADVITNASTGTPLAPGSTLNVLGTVASTFQGGMAITCTRTLATGTIGPNPVAGTGDVTGSITTLSFDGGAATTRCNSSVVGLPYATVKVDASPVSPLIVTADAQAQTFAFSKLPGPGLAMTVSYYTAAWGGTPTMSCVYNAGSLAGPVNNAASTVQLLNAPLTYNAAASSGPGRPLCAAALPKLITTLKLTSGGANVSLQ
jgi:hypothetical protein